jgi:hypothetical protein
MDSPSECGDATDQQSVTSGGHKLTKDEEEYLDKLLAEKRIVDATHGLDSTQKLINSGKNMFMLFTIIILYNRTIVGGA